jgi:mono/diheme cytochrome c family protein
MFIFRQTFSVLTAARLFLAAAVAASLTTTLSQAHDPVPKATWTRDVEPIISSHCMTCHSPEGSALPTLTTLEDVRTHRDAVKQAILERRMPIWGALRGFGAFKNDPSLSPQQIAIVAAWIEAGTPPGPPVIHRTQADLRASPAVIPGDPVRLRLPPFLSTQAIREDIVRLPSGVLSRIGGWQFIPGDATVQHVQFTDVAGRFLWNWSAGSTGAVALPKGVAMSVTGGGLKLITTRRTQDGRGGYRPAKSQESILVLWPVPGAVPLRWQSVACGATAGLDGRLYAIRPVRVDSGAIEVRATIPSRVLGRFTRTAGSPTYWLKEPADLSSRGLISVLGENCTIDLLTTAQVRRNARQ